MVPCPRNLYGDPMTSNNASNDPEYAGAHLRTIRLRRPVPPADQLTPGMIAALAQAAAKQSVRVLLSNGLRISPDGTVDRFPPSDPRQNRTP